MKKVDVGVMLTAMYEGRLPEVRLNAEGAEICDPVPMAPPVGYKKQPSMVEIVRDMCRSEQMRVAALEGGMESFEEADDFDVGDDFDPTSPYESDFEPTVAELRQRRFEAEQLRSKEEDDKDSSSLKQEDDNVESSTAGGVVKRGKRADKDSSRSTDEQSEDKRGAE